MILIPFAVIAQSSVLSDIENSVFGIDYKKESDLIRVERLEQHLYGSKRTGNIQRRIQAIQDDMGYSEPVAVKPQMPNPDVRNDINPDMNNEIMNMKEDSSVEYPIVDKMEEEVFKTTYKKDNIYKRLDRLEEKVFNRKLNGSLNERVDKLASVIRPQKSIARSSDSYSYTAEDLDKYYSQTDLEPVNSQSIVFQLAVLEQELLKNNYGNDNISNRLSRIENKLFNRTFPSDNDINRMQRVMVAYDAKKNSHKYENNRKMQNVATFSQLGGILLMILAILL